jgi:hypothetical protein
MKGAGGKVLEKSSGQEEAGRAPGKKTQGDQSESQHSRGAGGSDVPMKIPVAQGSSRLIVNFGGPDFGPLDFPAGKGRTGPQSLQVLGP